MPLSIAQRKVLALMKKDSVIENNARLIYNDNRSIWTCRINKLLDGWADTTDLEISIAMDEFPNMPIGSHDFAVAFVMFIETYICDNPSLSMLWANELKTECYISVSKKFE